MNYKILLILIFLTSLLHAQYVNIVPQLQDIEAGYIEKVQKDLIQLKENKPGDPNVIFLEAVVTEDGEKSRELYELVYNNFPNSSFADAALFRNFSFFYALGLYKKAEELKERLRKEYPKSHYLKNTDRTFPKVDEMIIVDSSPYQIKNSAEKRFTIQAGAFSDSKNAQNLKDKFISDGFISNITLKNVNNIQLHIVTVGSFIERTQAESFIDDLQTKYSITGRVIELK